MAEHPQGAALVETAASLRGAIREHAGEAEQARKLPSRLVELLRRARLFDLALPASFGGLEVDVVTLVRVLEELATADAATAWAVGIGAGTGIVSAHLPEATAREIFRPGVPTCGPWAPLGRAVPVEGGLRVTGRWPFASGCTHSAWVVGMSHNAERTAFQAGWGAEDLLMPVFPIADVEIVDTWHVCGLRGTGSRDVAVHDVFVPADRVAAPFAGRRTQDGALYRFPVKAFLALTLAPIPLGVARRAIDELVAIAEGKTPVTQMATGTKLRERAVTQYEIGQAEARLRSARAWLYEATATLWDLVRSGAEPTARDASWVRLACAHATAEAVKAVEGAFSLGGGSAIYESCPLQQCLRDVRAAAAHHILAPQNYELVGQVVLGLEPSRLLR
jgi:alkylation response protein AidB-like acyl-CoA dehydrogenase